MDNEHIENIEQLRPCPFCGKMPEFSGSEFYGNGGWSPSRIKCFHCNTSVARIGLDSDDLVMSFWNTRPIEDALRAEVARLTASVEAVQAEADQLREENSRTYCAYCGEAFIRDDQAASRVSEHIRTCEKHPMRKVELELHNSEMTRKWLSDENQRVRMLLMPILESEDPAEYVEKLQAELQQAREFHPRAMKLIGKRKDFIVIAEDEPYFVDAYMAIRRHEKFIKRWTAEDEQRYREAFTRWHQAQTNALPTPPEQEATE